MKHGPLLSATLVGILLIGLPGSAAQALDTIYIVRHADKAKFWPDDGSLDAFQPLSRDGLDRADQLSLHLREAKIAAIYTSSTTRTLTTGMPLAEVTGVKISPDDRSAARQLRRMKAFLTDLERTHRNDEAVLIVGHSNTVPKLLIELGAETTCFERLDIKDHDGTLLIHGFEGLWRIDLSESGCDGIERRLVALEPTEDNGQ